MPRGRPKKKVEEKAVVKKKVEEPKPQPKPFVRKIEPPANLTHSKGKWPIGQQVRFTKRYLAMYPKLKDVVYVVKNYYGQRIVVKKDSKGAKETIEALRKGGKLIIDEKEDRWIAHDTGTLVAPLKSKKPFEYMVSWNGLVAV